MNQDSLLLLDADVGWTVFRGDKIAIALAMWDNYASIIVPPSQFDVAFEFLPSTTSVPVVSFESSAWQPLLVAPWKRNSALIDNAQSNSDFAATQALGANLKTAQ